MEILEVKSSVPMRNVEQRLETLIGQEFNVDVKNGSLRYVIHVDG
jgi:hypothetical protein